jgi:ribokinase
VVAASGNRIYSAESHAVDVIDTTAAGDCFTAALAVAICEGRPLDVAVDFANAAAAISVTRQGAQPAMPTRAEVETFLQGPIKPASSKSV